MSLIHYRSISHTFWKCWIQVQGWGICRRWIDKLLNLGRGKEEVEEQGRCNHRRRGRTHAVKGILWVTNPKSLNYTIFLYHLSTVGTWGCWEHHKVHIEDLKIVKKAGTGKAEYIEEYIEWVEGLNKTCHSGLLKKGRRVPQCLLWVEVTALSVLWRNWYLEDLQLWRCLVCFTSLSLRTSKVTSPSLNWWFHKGNDNWTWKNKKKVYQS